MIEVRKRCLNILRQEPVKAFLASRLFTLGIAYGVFYFSAFCGALPPAPPGYVETGQGDLNWRPLNVLYYYDAVNYMNIAQHGYSDWRLTCWFPLYPLLIRVFGSTAASAVAASNLSLLAALFAACRLGGKKAVWLTAFSPISIVFSSAYSESLFLALTAWGMVMAERGKHGACGMLAGLAALARPPGWAAVAGFGAYFAFRREPKAAAKVILAGAAAGLLYPAYLFLEFGDPLLFAKANAHFFGRGLCFPLSGLLADFGHLFSAPGPAGLVILLNCAGFLLLLRGALTKWWPYTLAYALVILCSGITNQGAYSAYAPYVFGLLRYAGACVPVYLSEKAKVPPGAALSAVVTVLVACKWFIF